MALGSMSLNLAVPNGSAIDLTPVLASLVPTLSAIDLSIPILNSHQTRMAPRSRDEVLDSGALQLTKGTTVLVDMRGIGEGKLEDAGESGRSKRRVTALTDRTLRREESAAPCHYHGAAEAVLRVPVLVF